MVETRADIIRDAGDDAICPPEGLEVYRGRVPGPRSRQGVTKDRQKLERCDLVETEGEGRWARYCAVDQPLKAPLRERPA